MNDEQQRRPDWPPLRVRQVLKGMVLGFLLAGNSFLFGLALPRVGKCYTVVLWLVVSVAAMLAPTVWRRVYWGGVALLIVLGLVIGGTPSSSWLARRWVIDDGVQPADLLVVLSGSTYGDSLSSSSEDRFVYGLRLLGQGVAPLICFTSGNHDRRNRYAEICRQYMQEIGLDTAAVVPFAPIDTPVMTTRGEALSIAAMAPPGGWGRVLIVTSPTHVRRARAVFRQVGLDAAATPCPASLYRWQNATGIGERTQLFRALVYEGAAWLLYRRHGWL